MWKNILFAIIKMILKFCASKLHMRIIINLRIILIKVNLQHNKTYLGTNRNIDILIEYSITEQTRILATLMHL